MDNPWLTHYSTRALRLRSSSIREILKYAQRPDLISFAGGLPAPELFPVERLRDATLRLLGDPLAGRAALQYGVTEGYGPLRELVVRHTQRYGIRARPENILITTGSQQALSLLGLLFINRGDRVAVEAPTYLGALQAFDICGAEYLSLATDDFGMCTEDTRLARVLAHGPKFLYVLPNFQNPSGTTLPLARRSRIVAQAATWGVPIVEDDPYGQLRYEGEHLPPLLVLDRARNGDPRTDDAEHGNVIYLGTFSKILSPGLRVGWVIAPTDVISHLAVLKQGTDLHTSTFTQQLVYEVAREGFLDEHIVRLRAAYRERRDAMLAALEAEMPPDVTWSEPEGGLFLWLRLPPDLESQTVLQAALRKDVAFVPGDAFFAPDVRSADSRRFLRLNFSCATPARIETGIRRLAQAVREQMPAQLQAEPL